MTGSDDRLCVHLKSAVSRLDDVIDSQPDLARQDLVEAVRLVVQVRDELVARHRSGPEHDAEQMLDTLNSVLSVLVGGEYPVAGVRLARVREGRDHLAPLIPDPAC